MKFKLLLFLLIFSISLYSQVVVKVIDSIEREALPGVSIYDVDKNSFIGITNENGEVYITLKSNTKNIRLYLIGYKPKVVKLTKKEQTKTIVLSPLNYELMPVVVTSESMEDYLKNNKIGEIRINPELILSKPSFMGENDAFKILQLFSGISFSTELSSNYIVRGSAPSENLILIDGAPVFNINHFGGFVSILPGDYIKNMNFYKSYIPVEYSQRSASVLDIKTKDGKINKHSINVSLSTIAANFNLSGPISKKHNITYFFGYRRSFLGDIINALKLSTEEQTLYFDDIFMKLSKKFNKGKIQLVYLHTTDLAQFKTKTNSSTISDTLIFNSFSDEKYGLKWQNNLISLKSFYRLSPKLYSEIIAYYSDYNFSYFSDYYKDIYINNLKEETEIYDTIFFNMNFGNLIKNITIQNHYSLIIQNNLNLNFGFKYHLISLTPNKYYYKYIERLHYNDYLAVDKYKEQINDSIEYQNNLNSYLSLNYKNRFIQIWAGATFDLINLKKPFLQPRIALNLFPTDYLSLKMAIVNAIQNEHQIVPTFFDLPIDYWVFSNEQIPPINLWHYSIGLYYGQKKLKIFLEAFYKYEKNILKILPGESFLNFEKPWQQKVDIGIGKSYGFETGLEISTKLIYLNLNYSYYPVYRQFKIINNAIPFHYKYDRTHYIKLHSILKVSNKLSLSANWTYTGGYWTTVSKYIFPLADYFALSHGSPPSLSTTTWGYPFYTELNNYKLPDYHRLDINFNYKCQKRKYSFELNLGVYNVYKHYNIFGVYVVSGSYYSYSLFNFLPYLSLKFKF